MRCILFLLLLCAVLAACNLPKPAEVLPTNTSEPEPEVTDEPTAEPTPEPASEKILILRSDEKPMMTGALAEGARAYCGSSCEVAEIGSLTDEESFDAVKAVILPGLPQDLSAIRTRFPQAKVAFIGGKEDALQDAWLIRYSSDNLPFLMGMATEMAAYDWRGIGLLPSDSELYGPNAEEAFVNGGHYFCGNCRATLAPYNTYPMTVMLPSDSGDWAAKLSEAKSSVIYTVFLSAEAESGLIYTMVPEMNAKVLGTGSVPEALTANWQASLHYDWAATIRSVMEADEMQGITSAVLAVETGTDPGSFGSGKTEMLQQTYASLLSGALSPLSPDAVYN